uniref:Uncharacterized protein n=1 Tax=Trichogramma kaykai TaxID=54128 RepID=A0ABD2VYV5_9HYME
MVFRIRSLSECSLDLPAATDQQGQVRFIAESSQPILRGQRDFQPHAELTPEQHRISVTTRPTSLADKQVGTCTRQLGPDPFPDHLS